MAKLLDKIDVPADVRRLARSELPQLAKELREFVVQMVSQTGGHFSSITWVAAWLGWTLDAFDFTIFLLLMVPISKDFGVPLTEVPSSSP